MSCTCSVSKIILCCNYFPNDPCIISATAAVLRLLLLPPLLLLHLNQFPPPSPRACSVSFRLRSIRTLTPLGPWSIRTLSQLELWSIRTLFLRGPNRPVLRPELTKRKKKEVQIDKGRIDKGPNWTRTLDQLQRVLCVMAGTQHTLTQIRTSEPVFLNKNLHGCGKSMRNLSEVVYQRKACRNLEFSSCLHI